MREITFEESKPIMIETLKSIDKCCRENNIKYSICWGTMIGAIRHHGFVPWDDDVDIMMKRDEYNRFLKVYNDPNYKLYTPQKDKNCILLLSRVYNKNTEVVFNYYSKSYFGLWISIFPYDNAPDADLEKWEKKRTFWVNLYHIKSMKYLTTESIGRKVIKFVCKIPLSPFSSFWLFKKIEKCLTMYNGKRTKNICIWDNGFGFTKFFYFPAELFDEFIDVDFDGVKCKIIKGYDQFLRMYYGDYMTPPPVEKQAPSHDYKAYYVNE